MARQKRIALTGGGTGGHIYPNLAVAEAILEIKKSKLFYIGHEEKLEADLLKGKDLKDATDTPYSKYIKFEGIKAEPLPRSKNPIELISWGLKFISSTLNAGKILKENEIDIVFGTGGYVAAPVFAAAILKGIPYIIHNLDAHMGLANQVFIERAKAVTLAFRDLENEVKEKNDNVVVTGNPIAKKFLENLEAKENKDSNKRLNLLITGGSQGAKMLNDAVGKLLPDLSTNGKINVIHVTGAKLYQDYVEKYLNNDIKKYSNYKVVPYTHQMPQLCSNADIAICRSGAMTIAEMVSSGVVPIFVPLPWAAHDHQNLNALSLVATNAALLIKQPNSDATEEELKDFKEKLEAAIKQLIDDRNLLQYMRENLLAQSTTSAAKDLAKLILESK